MTRHHDERRTGNGGGAGEPVRFLTGFAQAVATIALYAPGHPARERAIDGSYEQLRELQAHDPAPRFSFLGGEVVYGERALRELKEWDWGTRLANVGVQRLEFPPAVGRDDYGAFLDEVIGRMGLVAIDLGTAAMRPDARPGGIRFGAIGVRGETGETIREDVDLPTATIAYSLTEEADTVRWMHAEVQARNALPLMEAEAVVRSLSVAMHADSAVVLPLVQLKEFDQYTTTHSLNVSVLAMGLAEQLGLGAKDVRAYGVAGLLHDLGKVKVPKDILNKPGKLTDDEWKVMRSHPVEGAKLIVGSDRNLDLAAAVAYEHHIMLDGGGYPGMHFCRECHHASRLVHICDVYDALRTRRPYRDAWDAEKTLAHIERGAGNDFDPDLVQAFGRMMRQWESRDAIADEPGADAASAPAAPQPAGAA